MNHVHTHDREHEVTDPVCGMTVDPKTSELRSDFGGITYHFCGATCKSAFDVDPARYVGAATDPVDPRSRHR